MKMTIDIECTPEEARRFFGMPDVTPVNALIVDEMRKQTSENIQTLGDPERLMAQWMAMSGKGLESMQSLMASVLAGSGTKSDKS